MGRRKISIAPITDDRNRQVTFLKRKNGLFKKAYELGVLCSADVAVVVFNANGKLFEFGSGDLDTILLRYSHVSHSLTFALGFELTLPFSLFSHGLSTRDRPTRRRGQPITRRNRTE